VQLIQLIAGTIGDSLGRFLSLSVLSICALAGYSAISALLALSQNLSKTQPGTGRREQRDI
jgi:hypothetical protein